MLRYIHLLLPRGIVGAQIYAGQRGPFMSFSAR
jgi:hypothetical protein